LRKSSQLEASIELYLLTFISIRRNKGFKRGQLSEPGKGMEKTCIFFDMQTQSQSVALKDFPKGKGERRKADKRKQKTNPHLFFGV